MNIRLASTLLQFLWQGTVIAALYAAARRTRRPELRYFLSCLALLAMAAAPVVTFLASAPHYAGDSTNGVIATVASPALQTTAVWSAATVHAHIDGTTWIVFIWFIGAMAFSLRLAGGWILTLRLRSKQSEPAPSAWQTVLDRLRVRLRLARPVQLVVSKVVQVPTVVGWLRPVVLVPLGALTGLEPSLVEALLAHELAHVRRHDYLVNVLQGVVESLLFYHPAVWWVSKQIRIERELCCDDIAVTACGDTLTYVRALSELESRRPWHPALAANGGSLPGRIGRLLGIAPRESNSLTGPVVSAILLVAAAFCLSGQSTPPPAFEVASVKQNKSGSARAPSQILPGGRFTATNNTVRALILNAYGITASPSLLSGGPTWIDSDAYDIDATPEVNSTTATLTGKPLWDKTRLMLRTLLADRFKLSMHRETKEMSIYELVVAKGGAKLKASAVDCTSTYYACHGFSGNPRRLTGTGIDMYDLSLILTNYSDRPVVDKTGIQGIFDVFLQWNPFAGRPAQPAADDTPPPTGGGGKEGPAPDTASLPDVFEALQQQVGLKLQAEKGSVDAWVIDQVERPSEN